jgi:hypothetical protein
VPKDERKCIVEHEREVKRFFVSAQKKEENANGDLAFCSASIIHQRDAKCFQGIF